MQKRNTQNGIASHGITGAPTSGMIKTTLYLVRYKALKCEWWKSFRNYIYIIAMNFQLNIDTSFTYFRTFGLGYLYRGLDAKLIQSFVTAGFMFLTYEKMSAILLALLLPSTRNSLKVKEISWYFCKFALKLSFI